MSTETLLVDDPRTADAGQQLRAELARAQAALRRWLELAGQPDPAAVDAAPDLSWQLSFHQRRVAALQRACEAMDSHRRWRPRVSER